jgi:hypothetical protein
LDEYEEFQAKRYYSEDYHLNFCVWFMGNSAKELHAVFFQRIVYALTFWICVGIENANYSHSIDPLYYMDVECLIVSIFYNTVEMWSMWL